MNIRTLFTGIMVFAIFALTGCASTYKENSLKGAQGLLEPSTTLKFSDVPVPVGFKLLPYDSYSFQTSGVRVGVLKYRGKANPDQVVNFFKEQMSMFNWNLLNIIEYGQRILNFDKEAETCIITLSGKGNDIIVSIALGPKAQNVPKRTKEPIK